jgi:hypothetical protein
LLQEGATRGAGGDDAHAMTPWGEVYQLDSKAWKKCAA